MTVRRLIDQREWHKPNESSAEAAPEPMTVRIDAACRLTGISRSQIYELIRAGRLETVKIGRVNLIRYHSLKRLVGQ